MRTSAGLLPYQHGRAGLEVFVGHMGGPFWARKDEGAWTIIKGLYDAEDEDPLVAAHREFAEETGVTLGEGEVTPLGQLRASGKILTVYAEVADPSLAFVSSNTVTMEWPPRSGRTLEFPELDRAQWMPLDEARRLLVKGQRPFLSRLEAAASGAHPLMVEEDDPNLARVREICLSFPGAAEKLSHGRPNFFTRKVFAVFGGSLKGDHYAPVARHALLFLPDASEREALLQDERFFVPAYYGPSGWLGLSFHLIGDVDRVDWTEVAELVEMSYRLTAPAALVRELDARSS